MVPAPEVEQLVKLFPGAEQEQVLAFRRLYGAVQLLLGKELRFLHRDVLQAAADVNNALVLFQHGSDKNANQLRTIRGHRCWRPGQSSEGGK